MPTITIKQILERDKEYPSSTDFADVESSVSSEVFGEVSGPTAITMTDIESAVGATDFTEATGPSVLAFSDVIYNMTKTLYVTNINSFEFGFVPFNDTLSYDE